jgi:5-methylcytosine-specific restriction endonuclease McrA
MSWTKKQARQEEYKKHLQSPYWQEVKRMVRMRDRFTCRDCGKRKLVEVHHLTYAHRGHEKEHLDDLICLCPKCHRARHAGKQKNTQTI